MTLYHWSQTAANNATADITCPFPEGQAPSSLNDGTRGMMAAIAKFRDDISGQIATGGTSTAYTVSSFQGFDSLADMHGKSIAFTPHTTNGTGPVTLNVDSLGAKPLRSAPSTEFLGGVLVQGTPYIATYNNTDGAFYVRGIFNSPYSVPLGGMLPYVGSSAPNSSFALPYGQAISRTTYASLFALCGTAFGTGDGSTTFNIPDLRGRLPVALDTMGGAASGRLTTAGGGIDGTTVGASGGAQSYTMVRSDMPNVQPTFTGSASGQSFATSTNNATVFFGTGSTGSFAQSVNLTAVAAPSGTVQSLNGGVTQTAMKMMPPAIVVPYLIRII